MSQIESKVKKEVKSTKKKKLSSKKVEDVKVASVTTKGAITSKNSVGYINKRVDPKSKWCVIELAEDITFEEHSDIIEKKVIDLVGPDTDYFVPFFKEQVCDKVVSLILFEGYFFVQSTKEILKSPEIFRNEYFKGPMKKLRKVVEIDGDKINKLKRELRVKLKERVPKKKQIVIPKIGVFSNLEGEVIDVDKKNLVAIVKFQYSTRIVEAPINFINLTIKE